MTSRVLSLTPLLLLLTSHLPCNLASYHTWKSRTSLISPRHPLVRFFVASSQSSLTQLHLQNSSQLPTLTSSDAFQTSLSFHSKSSRLDTMTRNPPTKRGSPGKGRNIWDYEQRVCLEILFNHPHKATPSERVQRAFPHVDPVRWRLRHGLRSVLADACRTAWSAARSPVCGPPDTSPAVGAGYGPV